MGIANIINAQMASSRLLYSMGRDGVIPRVFGKVHPKFQTPWFASIFLGAITLCLALPLQDYMGTLAGFVNFGALSSFILLNFAVFFSGSCVSSASVDMPSKPRNESAAMEMPAATKCAST